MSAAPESRRSRELSQRWLVVLLGAVLVLGTGLRLLGIDYGLPFPLVSDEEILIGGALRMAQTTSFVPTFDPALAELLYYPVGLPYAFLALFVPTVAVIAAAAGFPPASELPTLLAENIGVLFLIARSLSAVLGVATIFIVYRIGARLFASPGAGIVAALLFATSWYHVVLSQVARHWSATVFLVWLAVLIGVTYYATPTRRRVVVAALVSAMGFAVSFIGVLGFGGFVVGHLARYRTQALNGRLMLALGVLAVGCGVGAALHVPAITRLVGASPVLPVDEAKTLVSLVETLSFYVTATWFAEPVLIVAGVVGAMVAVRRSPFVVGLMVATVAGYLVFLFLFLPLEDRYILPVMPAFALTAGGGFAAAFDGSRGVRLGRWALVALVAIAGAFAGNSALAIANLMHRTDTRTLALQWVQENLPEDARVVVSLNPVKLATGVGGLRDQMALDAESLDFADRLALEKGRDSLLSAVHLNRFARDRFYGAVAADLLSALRVDGYRYFVLAQRQDLAPNDFHMLVSSAGALVVSFDPAPGVIRVFPPDLRTTSWVHDHPVFMYGQLQALGPRVAIFDLESRD